MSKTQIILKNNRRWFLSLLAVLVATCLAELVKTVLPSRDLIMFYLLAVVVVALRWGRGPAIVASLASVLVFDFLFVPPRFQLITLYAQDWVVLVIFLFVGITISALTAQTRENDRTIELMREKERLQTILLNSISHDLKTPLVSITGALSSLLDEKSLDKSTRQELIETAYEDSNRLNQLVGNLLDMARLEASALKLSIKPCDIKDLIGAALQHFSKEQMGSRAVSIHTAKELPEVPVDFTFMMKVLVNILDNALKYSLKDSRLNIEAKALGPHLHIEIVDEGFGIPEKDLKHIFDKFYRVNQTQKIPGTGLGLAIAKGIVEAHKGKIWAEKQSQGTKIIVALPY